ncbi:hypothetical protein P3L10_031770 [Capsicum annuum]
MHAQPSDICYPGALPQLTPRIGHVMLVVGYGYDVQGVLYFVCKNTWGTEWGANGYLKFSASMLFGFYAPQRVFWKSANEVRR